MKSYRIALLICGIYDRLDALHALGLVHCDSRPMNVFVTIEDERYENGMVLLNEVVVGDSERKDLRGSKAEKSE